MTRLLLGLIGAVIYRRLGHDIDEPIELNCELPWSVVDLKGQQAAWRWGIADKRGDVIARFDDWYTASAVVLAANK